MNREQFILTLCREAGELGAEALVIGGPPQLRDADTSVCSACGCGGGVASAPWHRSPLQSCRLNARRLCGSTPRSLAFSITSPRWSKGGLRAVIMRRSNSVALCSDAVG
jgi:hypothetical protein